MKHSLSLNEGKIIYDFDDAKEFQGKTFISFHKMTKYKDSEGSQVRHQNLTCRTEDKEAVFEWLEECINGVGEIGKSEIPF